MDTEKIIAELLMNEWHRNQFMERLLKVTNRGVDIQEVLDNDKTEWLFELVSKIVGATKESRELLTDILVSNVWDAKSFDSAQATKIASFLTMSSDAAKTDNFDEIEGYAKLYGMKYE